jgi:hypothetical protein
MINAEPTYPVDRRVERVPPAGGRHLSFLVLLAAPDSPTILRRSDHARPGSAA